MSIRVEVFGNLSHADLHGSGSFTPALSSRAIVNNLVTQFYDDMEELALAAMTAGIPESNFICYGPDLKMVGNVATINGGLAFKPVKM